MPVTSTETGTSREQKRQIGLFVSRALFPIVIRDSVII